MSSPGPLDAIRQVRPERRVKILAQMPGRGTLAVERPRQERATKRDLDHPCQRLDICEQRFRQLREELLRAALASLEDQPAGRPRRPEEPAETAALRQQLEALQRELQVAQVREEIVLALPQVRVSPAAPGQGPAPQKKRRPKP